MQTRVYLVPYTLRLSIKLFCSSEEFALVRNGIYTWKYTLEQTLNTSLKSWCMCAFGLFPIEMGTFWKFSVGRTYDFYIYYSEFTM